MDNYGISICISAYNTAEYIEECLDSVAKQTWFKDHDNWEILLGIDGCEKTLSKVRSIMHKYKNLRVMMMDKNVGTYVTCNTIMKEAKYGWLLRFDSDDVMNPDMVEILLNECGDADFCRFKHGYLKGSRVVVSCGQILIKKDILFKYGGYNAWKCEADSDLIVRLEKHVKMKIINKNVFKYRSHNGSLTTSKSTGYSSPLRREYRKHTRLVSKNNPYVDLVVASFTEEERIIVSMTSWKKRIHFVAHVVDLMMKQTRKPNKIILNLSTDEFTNKENDLPKELLDKQNNIFEIFWVKENTKVYKKLMPTLERFPNDVIINIDDDIEYPENFIDKLYLEYCAYDKQLPITSGEFKWENDIFTHYGCFSLVKKSFFGEYLDDLYKNVVLKHGIDKIRFFDPILTYSVLLNGLRYRFTPYFNMSDVRKKSPNDKVNRYSEIGESDYNQKMKNEHEIIRKYIKDKYGKSYKDIFVSDIIVNITTYPKRDKFLPTMLESVKKQTIKPKKIVLWVSKDEYNEEKLPKYLQECLDKGLLTDIMWVNKNVYCHKRTEAFKYFKNCYNIFMDDDILYDNKFIEEVFNASVNHQDSVIVYTSNSVEYNGTKITKEPIVTKPSHKNNLLCGCCCFAPYMLPKDVFEKTYFRDKYVTKCDESWIKSILIKHDIKVFALHNMLHKVNNKNFKTISDTQKSALYNENNKVDKIGIREKERNLYNAIKINGVEKEAKKIWPNIGIDNYKVHLADGTVCYEDFSKNDKVENNTKKTNTNTHNPVKTESNRVGYRIPKKTVKRRVVTRHSTFMSTY